MQLLPLLFALLFLLTFLTFEQIERFKGQSVMANEMGAPLFTRMNAQINLRQDRLYGKHRPLHRVWTFRPFLDEKMRLDEPTLAAEHKKITASFLRVIYQGNQPIQNILAHRPQAFEQLLTAVEVAAAARVKERPFRSIEEIATLHLGDPELQELWFYILRGNLTHEEATIKRKEAEKNVSRGEKSPRIDKDRVSFLTYINNERKWGVALQHAPRPLLIALFGKEEVADAIITQRNTLNSLPSANERKEAFQMAFEGKQASGVDPKFLIFDLSSSNKEAYD